MFRDLMRLQNEVNRVFDDVFPKGTRFRLPHRNREEEAFAGTDLYMPVDIYEEGDHLILKADLPDVDPKDIDIRIEGNTLYLKGERKFEKEVKEENFYRMERSYGSFSRSFTLPHNIDTDKIDASFKNGVLRVTLPKTEESKPKQIPIRAAGESRKIETQTEKGQVREEAFAGKK